MAWTERPLACSECDWTGKTGELYNLGQPLFEARVLHGVEVKHRSDHKNCVLLLKDETTVGYFWHHQGMGNHAVIFDKPVPA